MLFSHYSAGAVEVVLKLTNTLNVVTGEDALRTPEDVADLVRSALVDTGRGRLDLTDRDLRFARTLRSRLRSVWEADDAAGAASAVNEVLELVAARPRILVAADTPPQLRFDAGSDDPVKRLGAVAALGVSLALVESGWERFGTCGSAACDDVYIDTSKNRSRLYCSDTCTTRESVAAYRARHKATG